MNGAQQITCDSSGQWKPQPPQCVPIPDDKIQPSPGKGFIFLPDTPLTLH